LLGSAFPHPIYDVKTRRPFYTPELQEACLEVRRRNIGINGKPVLFYERQKEVAPKRPKRSGRKAHRADDHRYRDLIDGLRSLGMAGVTAGQVEEAMKSVKVSGMDNGEVLKAVFLHLKRQDISPSPSSPKKKPSRGD
jgi:DNA-binding transcriptional MerR regulator